MTDAKHPKEDAAFAKLTQESMNGALEGKLTEEGYVALERLGADLWLVKKNEEFYFVDPTKPDHSVHGYATYLFQRIDREMPMLINTEAVLVVLAEVTTDSRVISLGHREARRVVEHVKLPCRIHDSARELIAFMKYVMEYHDAALKGGRVV